jgi:hypothetical protein
MFPSYQTTSEEDRTADRRDAPPSDDPTRHRGLSPVALGTPTTQFMQAPQEEWFVAHLLDGGPSLIACEPRVLYRGRDCPVSRHVDFEAFFDEARRLGAKSLITVRYHPHPLPRWTENDYQSFQTYCLAAKAHRVPVRDHLTLTAAGDIVSWRHWPYQSAGVSGTSVRNCSAILAWYSAAITPFITGCMSVT